MRVHSIAYAEPRADDLQRWLARVHEDNFSRASAWASFKMLTEAHAGCVVADLGYVDGVTCTRLEGLVVKVAFTKASALAVLTLVLGHGGKYTGTFRSLG